MILVPIALCLTKHEEAMEWENRVVERRDTHEKLYWLVDDAQSALQSIKDEEQREVIRKALVHILRELEFKNNAEVKAGKESV